ncbi:MAG TPA: EamA family transporter [Gemmatimonadales bacterium]|nr:EamA family transporter [Gemmatimonadales bacterium]
MRWKIAIAFFAVYVCWGMTYLAMRVAVMEIPPHLLSGSRFLLAGVLLYAWARLRGHAAPTLTHWRSATVIGGFLLLGGNASVAWAEKTVPSGLAAVLIAVAPIWMVGLEWARGGPRPTRAVAVGLLLGLAGVALLVSGRGPAESRVDPLGATILVLASASWAWGSVVSKSAALPKSPFVATSIEMIAGGILLLVTAAVSGQFRGFDPVRVSFEAMAWWGYLVVFGSLVGFTAYIWLLGVTSIAKAGTYAYVNPIVAVLLGWAVLHEPVTMRMLLAAGIILVGVALVNIDWSATGLAAYLPERSRPSRAR